MNIDVTIVIVAITVIVSIIALRDERLERKLIFNPYIIYRRREYWRFLTAALIHGNYLHLGLNMFVLYQFGSSIEKQFDVVYGNNKWLEALYYLGLYIPGAILSGFYSFEKNKNNIHYNALGSELL